MSSRPHRLHRRLEPRQTRRSGLTGSLNTVPEAFAWAQYKFERIGGGLQAIICVDVNSDRPHTDFAAAG